jgi:hypothetical protein
MQTGSTSHFPHGKMTAKGKVNHDFKIRHDSPHRNPAGPPIRTEPAPPSSTRGTGFGFPSGTARLPGQNSNRPIEDQGFIATHALSSRLISEEWGNDKRSDYCIRGK